jgi:hypothetical protein
MKESEIMFSALTDEEVARFIKEFDEGKHPLSDAQKDALSTVGFRRSLQMSTELDRLRAFERGALVRYDTYEKTIASLTETLEFYKKSMKRIANAVGIETPLQLIALAENNEENYVDLLLKHIALSHPAKEGAK